ncbi:hypothetical protein JCM10908_006886 [Rhodotorula pacifica]|uniref:uncharacterized protein n=1 Tax=Rhodotorula pacifica TaxID=1495444 RepID=UPI00318233B1
MQFPTSIAFVLSLVTLSQVAQSLPTLPRRDINISHKSLANGTTTTHSITNADLPAELAKALEGSDVNINLTTDRQRRSTWVANVKRAASSSGVNNSTINLTVIGTRSLNNATTVPTGRRQTWAERQRAIRDVEIKTALNSNVTASPINAALPAAETEPEDSVPTGTHHNIHIDASSSGQGGVGGIHNSTVNINLHQITTNNNAAASSSRKLRRRKVALGDHSVLVDVSAAGSSSPEEESSATAGGIEDSTVHVNILPGRALTKSTGHHSIVVDSSSLGQTEAAESSTETGSHSAVVDTSSSASSESTGPAGVKNSTINLTVIAPSDSGSSKPAAEDDSASVPALSRLSKRAAAASEEWEANFIPLDHDIVEPVSFIVVRRDHSSRMRA